MSSPEKSDKSDEVHHEDLVQDGVDKSTATSAPIAPNGGLKAWLQVLGGFLVFFNIWGIPISFGAYEAFYKLRYLPSYSPSAIAWIGTVQGFLLVLLGFFGGPLYDLGYYPHLLVTGSFFTVFGNMMLSLSEEYYQVFLSQGICMGLGCGLLYVPSLALVAASFTTKRSIAMGIVTSGVGVGGIIYTLVFEQLIFRVGFPWTNRVLGFISLVAFLIAIPCLLAGPSNTGNNAKKRRSLIDPTAFRDTPFLTFSFAQFFIFLGYIVPLFYIPTFAEVVLRTTHSTALYILVGSQAASVFGRLAAAFAAHYAGVMAPWTLCAAVSAALCLAWIGIADVGGFVAFCVLYGFFTGALIALPPSIFPACCPDPAMLGTRLGMSWTLCSISLLIGSPIAGAIVGGDLERTRDMTGVQAWSGVVMFVGVGFLAVLWVLLLRSGRADAGRRWRVLI